MIQINLLPDVKLAYLKAEQQKHLVTIISILASAVSLLIFIPLFLVVHVVQSNSLSSMNANLQSNIAALNSLPDLGKILTIQNQLSVLTGLHDQKAAVSRLPDYLSQVTPSEVTISNISVDYQQHTMSVSGNAPSLDVVNTFVDTLKFTSYTTDATTTATKAFSSVVLAGFSRSPQQATYNITLAYDPPIFDITRKVKLTVPSTVTTRSVTEQPTALFKKNTDSK